MNLAIEFAALAQTNILCRMNDLLGAPELVNVIAGISSARALARLHETSFRAEWTNIQRGFKPNLIQETQAALIFDPARCLNLPYITAQPENFLPQAAQLLNQIKAGGALSRPSANRIYAVADDDINPFTMIQPNYARRRAPGSTIDHRVRTAVEGHYPVTSKMLIELVHKQQAYSEIRKDAEAMNHAISHALQDPLINKILSFNAYSKQNHSTFNFSESECLFVLNSFKVRTQSPQHDELKPSQPSPLKLLNTEPNISLVIHGKLCRTSREIE